MTDEMPIGALRAAPLFDGLPDRTLGSVAASGKIVRHAAGRSIVEEGNEGVGLHVILSGTASVRAQGREVAKLQAGSFFGEMALLEGGRRTATVAAETPVETFSITSWGLKTLMQRHPELERRLREEMERRRALADPGSSS